MFDLLALIVAVVLLSLAVYHIAQFSTKETPFEQVLAEQRQKRELEGGSNSNKNEKLNKKNKPQKKVKPKKDEAEAHPPAKETTTQANASSTLSAHLGKKNEAQAPEKVAENSQQDASTENDQKKDKKKKDHVKVDKDETKKQEVLEKKKQSQTQAKGSHNIVSVGTSAVGKGSDSSKEKSASPFPNKEPTAQLITEKVTKGLPVSPVKIVSTQATLTKNSKEVTVAKSQLKETPVNGLVQETISSKQQSKEQTKSHGNGSVKKLQEPTKGIVNSNISQPIVAKSKEGKIKISKESEVSREQLDEIDSELLQRTDNSEKKKKKDKSEEKKSKQNITSDDSLKRLMPIIHKSNLSGGEIQMLIDDLLNKQQLAGSPGGEWVEKGRVDPVKEVKRQLDEAETRLKEQTEAHKALSAKISDLRTDLNSERSRSSSLKKKLEAVENSVQQKLDASASMHKDNLAIKINEMKATIEKEYQVKLVQQKQTTKLEMEQLEQELRSNLAEMEQQLMQARSNNLEVEKLQQQTQAAFGEAQQQLQQVVQSKDEVLESCQQYNKHINMLKEQLLLQETTYNSRIVELQESLSASENALSQAMPQITNTANERDQLQQQLINLGNVRDLLSQNQIKLKETQVEKNDLEIRLLNSEKELSRHRELVINQKSQIECLREEKESLASQSVRPAAEGQENGDIHSEQTEQISSNNLNEIYEEQISCLTKEVSKLKEDLAHQRIKNDELRTKNHKAMEALFSTEEILKTRLKKQAEADSKWEKESKLTRQVLSRLFPGISSSENLDHSTFLNQVETAAVAAQTSLAEVKPVTIEKIVEKIVKDPVLIKQVDELKIQNEELIKKVEVLQNQEKLSVEAKKSSGEEQDRRITELEIENKYLEGRVGHYQSVLSNTETLLKTLQSSVEIEETSWKEKLVEKEEAVCQLNADKINLTLRVTELQSALDKVQQAEEMESQLNSLKEKLNKEELEKTNLKEQLHKVQEQLKVTAVSQTAMNAYKAGSMGYMMAWITNNYVISNLGDKVSSLSILPPSVASLSASTPTCYSSLITSNSFNKIFNGIQAINTNGPSNGIECPEDDSSLADSVSLVSASSASVSEGQISSNLEGNDTNIKKKKKKKSFFKLIR